MTFKSANEDSLNCVVNCLWVDDQSSRLHSFALEIDRSQLESGACIGCVDSMCSCRVFSLHRSDGKVCIQ